MADNNTTQAQFLEMMKTCMNPEFYMNFIKNLPVMDVSSMMESINKIAKIMTTINQVAAESGEFMARKNSEAFQMHTMEMVNSINKAMASGDLKQVTELQQRYLKSSYETLINNAKEFAKMPYDASAKIMEILNSMTQQMSQNTSV